MARYTFPSVYGVETSSQDGPIRATALGYGCLIGITEKGPVGTPVRTRTFDAWKKIFGSYETRSDMAYEAEAFFLEGGFELITIRQVNYSNVDDKTSYTGVVANHTFITEGVAATSASKTTSAGTFNFSVSGLTVVLDVDNAGDVTSTFTATPTDRRGTGATYASMNGKLLNFILDGSGVSQQVVFSAAATDAATTAAQINAVIVGGYAQLVDSDEVAIFTDIDGSNGSVQILASSTALVELGMTAGTTANTGSNVGNIRAVTALEVKTIIEGATTATVTVNDNGSATIYSPTTGGSSELDFDVTSTGLTVLGLVVEVIVGTAAGATFNTLKVESGYRGTKNPGLYGNRLKVALTQNPFHPSAVAGSEITVAIVSLDDHIHLASPKGLNPGSVLKITDGTNTEYKIVDKVTTTISGGAATFIAELTGQIVNGYLVAATTVESCEFDMEVYLDNVLMETWTGLSMYDSVDNYVEAVVNDENTGSAYVYVTDLDAGCGNGADIPATIASTALSSGTDETTGITDVDWIGSSTGKTGIYALDEVNDFLSFGTPGKNSAGVIHAATLYAKNRMWFEYVGYTPAGYTAAQTVSFRETTVGVNSSDGCLYAGGIKVNDPVGLGSSPKRSIRGIGAVIGLRSRVDNLPSPNGGPWQAPAGEGDYGTLHTALDVVDVYTDTEHGLMNDAHVNVIRKFTKTSQVTVWGARTLDASSGQNFRYINTRRQFQFFEKSIVDSTRWSVFRNNDYKLWAALKNRITSFLTSYLGVGAFPSALASEAFFVKVGVPDGVMDQADIDNGYVRGRIGLAPQKSAEFVVFEFSQFTSGLEVTE
jgi:phage tail sheath protein FI